MGVGCHIIDYFIACLLFADDMSLISPTRDALQRLLDVCASYCLKFCLRFNIAKTKVMVFGRLSRSVPSLARISINGEMIEYVEKCKYLGFNLVSNDHFKISVQEDLRGFFGSVNSILTCLQKPKENVSMQLFYSNCVPKLTYGAAVKDLTASEKNQFSVAVNNAIHRIFGFRYWQSIRQIREFFYFKSIDELFIMARRRFLVACTRLYTPLCPSVGWLVGRSVPFLLLRHF